MFVCDSRKIGVYYMIFSFFGGMLGFSFSVYMRLELSVPFSLIQDDFYFICMTSHGLVMLFFFLTVFASGFSNFLIPDICFLEDMYFKKINVFGFYIVILSFLFLVISLFFGEGVGTGWTLYVPLSLSKYTGTYSLELAVVSVHLFSFSSLLSSMNIILSILITLGRVGSIVDYSPFIVSYFLVSCLVVIAVPALTVVLTMLILDRNLNTFFFSFEFGGDPVLFQTIFWIFGHPEVYIIVLPVFGIVSMVVESLCGGELFNRIGIIFSMVSLSVLSFVVFGHHMVTVGYSLDFRGFFMTSTIVISIPTGVKIFSWLYSLFLFGIRFSISLGFLIVFLFFFSFGGLSGVFLSNVSLDLMFHDTYFVVGHFHTVLSVASLFGFFSGLLYFFRSMLVDWNSGIGVWSYFFISFTFFCCFLLVPFHLLGILGLPRRITCYSFEYYIFVQFSSVGLVGLYLLVCFLIFMFLILFGVLWGEVLF